MGSATDCYLGQFCPISAQAVVPIATDALDDAVLDTEIYLQLPDIITVNGITICAISVEYGRVVSLVKNKFVMCTGTQLECTGGTCTCMKQTFNMELMLCESVII